MSLTMSFHYKLCTSFTGQLFVRANFLSLQSNIGMRNIHAPKAFFSSLSNGNPFRTFRGSLKLAERKLLITGLGRNISFLTPKSITDKTKSVVKKVKLYLTGFVIIFALVYSFISYNISTVMYQLLKLQASNSISIKDESLEPKKTDN